MGLIYFSLKQGVKVYVCHSSYFFFFWSLSLIAIQEKEEEEKKLLTQILQELKVVDIFMLAFFILLTIKKGERMKEIKG